MLRDQPAGRRRGTRGDAALSRACGDNMPKLKDVQDSIDWVSKGGLVGAYFTAHFAKPTDEAGKRDHDSVHYAFGTLFQVGKAEDGGLLDLGGPIFFLFGDLSPVFVNTDVVKFMQSSGEQIGPTTGFDEGMKPKTNLAVRLEVYEDGTIGVQQKMGGKSVGGLPVEKVKGSQINSGLIQAASKTTAYTVSLDRLGKRPGFT
jgi:hypothetical protein